MSEFQYCKYKKNRFETHWIIEMRCFDFKQCDKTSNSFFACSLNICFKCFTLNFWSCIRHLMIKFWIDIWNKNVKYVVWFSKTKWKFDAKHIKNRFLFRCVFEFLIISFRNDNFNSIFQIIKCILRIMIFYFYWNRNHWLNSTIVMFFL